MPAEAASDDDGAAVVEFVMIAGLLLFLLFGVLQVAVFFYARNVAASSVADAARYASTEGIDPRVGARRAEQLIHDGLDDADADAIRCTSRPDRDPDTDLATVTVRCHGRVRLLFTPLGVPLTVRVTSSVLREGRR